LRFSN